MAEMTEADRAAANSYLSPAKERTIDGLVQAFAAHRDAAEKAERQAVVDWLREFGNHPPAPDCERCNAADAIERGDHRKG